MVRVLLVANKTLGGPAISEFVKSRMAEEECRFTLLVPATPHRHDKPPGWVQRAAGVASIEGGAIGMLDDRELSASTEDDYAHARSRLEYGLQMLKSWGAVVDGEVGDPDPAKAIKTVLTREHFDEVALSTLPEGVSRWLRLDIPHQVERKFRIPVTVIKAQ